MKKQNNCSKCGSTQLIRIPIMLGEGPHIAIGDRLMHSIPVVQFVCGACGFIETWVAGDDDLGKLREQYEQSR
jgi:ribosomal protein S27AE